MWPLTGRAAEFEFTDSVVRGVTGVRGVVLAGPAGVGKTRLAREVLASAARRGSAVRWASATSTARVLPFGAFAELLGATAGDAGRVLVHATEVLLADAGRAGVVIGVDDAHLLDELSALLVHRLVLHTTAVVVLTVTSGAPAPDVVTSLWKDGHLHRLDLSPLREPETGALLEAALGGPVDSVGAGRFWTLTRGNVLYLRHLVDGELDAGRLHMVDGVWRWSGIPVMSAPLAELVRSRMGRLAPPVLDVVDLLALGEPLGVPLLAGMTTAESVELAESRELVTVRQDGRRLQARLAHPLYRELRRTDMGLLRARRLRGRLASALAATGGRRRDDTLRRAVLSLESDLEPDPELLTEAAGRAAHLLDMALTERLARRALAAGAGFDARALLAFALAWLSRGAEAEAEFAALAWLARTDEQRTRMAIQRVGNLLGTLRRPAEALSVLNGIEAAVRGAEARQVLAGIRAAFEALLGEAHQAVERATEVLAGETPPDHAVVIATYGLVIGLGVLGRIDQARPAMARGHAAAARSAAAAALEFGLADFAGLGLRLAGYLPQAHRDALDHHRSRPDTANPQELYGIVLLGYAELGCGRPRTAARWLRQARAGLVRPDTFAVEVRCLLALTQALALAGEAEEAGAALAELDREWHPALGYLEAELGLARAWVAAAEGAVSEAVVLARAAAALAERRGHAAHEVVALQVAARLGDTSVAGRLAWLSTQVDGPRAATAAAHAAALAAGDGEALRASSVRLAELGDLLAAADAAAQAAVAHHVAGRRGSFLAAAARARRLADECEGARTPALLAAARPLPLTNREREVVTLAAGGLSNRAIAERLVMSVRTVEGHLYRAGVKLDAAGRTELARRLAET